MVYPAIKDRPMFGDGFTCSGSLPTHRISNILGMGWDHEWAMFSKCDDCIRHWLLECSVFIWLPIVVIFTRFVLLFFWISGHTNVHDCTHLTCAPPTAARRHAKHRLASYVEILTMNCPLAQGPKRIPFERCVLWRSWGLELSSTSVLYFSSHLIPSPRKGNI